MEPSPGSSQLNTTELGDADTSERPAGLSGTRSVSWGEMFHETVMLVDSLPSLTVTLDCVVPEIVDCPLFCLSGLQGLARRGACRRSR